MTHLLVAKADAVIKGTDGTLHRVHRGRTLAHPRHPVVLAAPQAFMPMEVQLPAPDADEDTVMAQVAEETAELRAEVDSLVATLTEVAGVLDHYGYRTEDREPGWLLRLLRLALTFPAPAPARSEEPAPVPPPRTPPRGPRKAAKPSAASGA